MLFSCPGRAPAASRPAPRTGGGGGGNTAVLNEQIEELNKEVMQSKLTIEGLEKERDFYFGKLRDIEVLAQEHENDPNGEFVQKVLNVLYATEVSSFSFKYLSGLYINVSSTGWIRRSRGRRGCPSPSRRGGILSQLSNCMKNIVGQKSQKILEKMKQQQQRSSPQVLGRK